MNHEMNDEDDEKAKLEVLSDLLTHAGELLMDMKGEKEGEEPMDGMPDKMPSSDKPEVDEMNPLKASISGKPSAMEDKLSAAEMDEGADGLDAHDDTMPEDDEVDKLKGFMEQSTPPNRKVGSQMASGRSGVPYPQKKKFSEKL
jgi:hypothetical protein